MSDIKIRPSEAEAEKYRTDGLWRHSGQIGDLRHWRDETPDACALIAYRSDAPPRRISYAELAGHVERFAGTLTELGVGPGDVAALQVPNFGAGLRAEGEIAPDRPARLSARGAGVCLACRREDRERVAPPPTVG